MSLNMLTFNNWIKLTESFSFDPDANYPDQTFGFAVGSVDSRAVSPGGEGGDWGGSMQRALAFGKIANDFVGKNIVSSQKRSKKKTASGHVSDHYEGSKDSYAIDLSVKGEAGDKLLSHLMKWCGHPEYKGGSWFNFNSGGYRYQIGWKVPNHFDHIHIGVKKTGESDSKVSQIESQTIPGKTPGEKILNNQIILNWLFRMMPELAPTLTPAQLNKTFSEHPEHFKWFKEKFGLNDAGDPVGSPDLSADTTDSEEAFDAALSSKKIKSNYTGEKANNINILINEISNQGITNKYAIIGILSTIGKESDFIPQNEIGYSDTSNNRIRSIFGQRVSSLSDSELSALKKKPVEFFDLVYGPSATSAIGWNTGNTQPGDGYKYRGRGFNQITFKSNYKKYSELTGIDLVSDPDKLNDVSVAAKVAVLFIVNGLKQMGIDPNSFKDKKSAISACVQVNAGGSSAPSGELAKAERIEKKFELV